MQWLQFHGGHGCGLEATAMQWLNIKGREFGRGTSGWLRIQPSRSELRRETMPMGDQHCVPGCRALSWGIVLLHDGIARQ